MNPQARPALSWDEVRERYIDWSTAWGADSSIKDDLVWRGYALWWSSTLMQKDAEVDKGWYESLYRRLNGEAATAASSIGVLSGSLRLLRLLAIDLLKWLLLRLCVPQPPATPPRTVWFHSLSTNIQLEGESAWDRMYAKAHLRDRTHGLRSGYAITLIPGLKDFRSPLRFKRRVDAMLAGIQRPAFVVNRLPGIADLLRVHCAVFARWCIFRRRAGERAFRDGFVINGVRCDDILLNELEKSFFGPFQWSMAAGLSFERWLRRAGEPQLVVTYAETVALLRPLYYFAKQAAAAHSLVSIQHTSFINNKLFLLHRAADFARDANWDGRRYSPMPDRYFVHGEHFKRHLERYYPADRIEVVGCLKNDRFLPILVEREQRASAALQKLGGNTTDRILLVTPSVNDFQDILSIFIDATLPAGWRVIITPHPFISLDTYRRVLGAARVTIPLEFSPGVSTQELLTITDLVVCGYSAVAFEAAIFGVPAVRIFSTASCPQFDDEPCVPSFNRAADFWSWFAQKFNSPAGADRKAAINRMVSDYFFRIDGRAADRLWEGLRPMAESIH
jgi:hypothetical protein